MMGCHFPGCSSLPSSHLLCLFLTLSALTQAAEWEVTARGVTENIHEELTGQSYGLIAGGRGQHLPLSSAEVVTQ